MERSSNSFSDHKSLKYFILSERFEHEAKEIDGAP